MRGRTRTLDNNTINLFTGLVVNQLNGLRALSVIGNREPFIIVTYNQVKWKVTQRNIFSYRGERPSIGQAYSFRFELSKCLGAGRFENKKCNDGQCYDQEDFSHTAKVFFRLNKATNQCIDNLKIARISVAKTEYDCRNLRPRLFKADYPYFWSSKLNLWQDQHIVFMWLSYQKECLLKTGGSGKRTPSLMEYWSACMWE